MDIKFAHVDVDRKDHLVETPMTVPGLYNWFRVFKGEFLEYQEIKGRVNEYDVIMVVLTTWDTKKRLVQKLQAESNHDTRIVVCVDYAPELWQQAFEIEWLTAELQAADLLFATVPMMVGMLRALAPDVPVQRLDHPIDVDALSNFKVARQSREDDCGYICHRYDNYWLQGYVLKEAIPDLKVHIILGNQNMAKTLIPYFKWIAIGGEYAQYVKWMAQRTYAIDGYAAIHSMGRFQADNAVLQIPTIGADVVHNQSRLWPALTTTANNWYDQIELMRQLRSDSTFWNSCVTYAADAVRQLDYKHSETNFIRMLGNEKAEIHTVKETPKTTAETGT